jgi:hypothetical protein
MDERLVEQIVGQVLARLGAPASDRAPAGSPSAAAASVLSNGELVLDAAVVTAETLEQRVNGHRHIAVGRRTVLTPSALDYLRTAGIGWTRGASAQVPGPAGTWAAIVSRATAAVEKLLNDTAGSPGPWRRELVGTPQEAARRATSSICRGEACGAIVFAECPEVVACLANRNTSIRAAVILDPAGVTSAIRSLGGNVFCVAPDGRSYFELRNLLRSVIAGGVPGVPAGWSEP